MIIFVFLLEAFLLNIALSIDSLISGIAYGSNKIKVPLKSLLVINLVCSGFLGLAIFFGSYISQYINKNITIGICITILIILGLIKIFDSFIKNMIKKYKEINKDIHFSFLSIKLTLNLYAKPEDSDFDRSKIISCKEALAVAVALSLDSITIGFGTGLVDMTIIKGIIIVLVSFIMGFIALYCGVILGEKIAKKISFNISWLGGVLLIIIAILKLFI